jgi:diguanylate cyclase
MEHTSMHRIDPAVLRQALELLRQASRDHAEWHDELLRVVVCGLPGHAADLAENAHQRCHFGRWYYEQAPAELRDHPAFAALGVEHEVVHRVAARLLRQAAAREMVAREDYDRLVAASARLRLELESLRHEVRAALRSRDPLTGAFGRVEMLPELREWHELVKRKVQVCSIAFMDLDQLKSVNDSFGHVAGDRVLAGAVRYLTGHLRPYDRIFRYGGDEFLLMLPGTDLATAQLVIRHAREGLASTPLASLPDGTMLHATASFGLAALDCEASVEDCVDRADQALLLAKTAGRNKVIVWDPSINTGARLKVLRLEDFSE